MSRHRGHTGRVDGNQKIIVEALEAAGVAVRSLAAVGDGMADLLCATAERTWLIEVKTKDGTLKPDQTRFFASWPGEIQLVRTIDDALATIGRRAKQ